MATLQSKHVELFADDLANYRARTAVYLPKMVYSLSDLLKFYGLMPLMITGDVAKIFV